MKLREHPLFIYCSLVLFYPIGLFFVLKSGFSKPKKMILSLVGGILFITVLMLPLILSTKQQSPADFNVIATRKVLSVGQSAGFAVYCEDDYFASFDASSDNNDILQITGNVYTAKSPGTCILTVKFADQVRNVLIRVTNRTDTSGTVYITPGGKRYHNEKKHAGKNAVAVTEEDALMSSKTPCHICYQPS